MPDIQRDKTQTDLDAPSLHTQSSILEYHEPRDLAKILDLHAPERAGGSEAFIENVQSLFKFSVNTWHQGFLQKLYGSTDAPGVAAELVLAALNQNVHVYEAAPVLTIVEKHVTRELALLFGFVGADAGGISTQGGSASNTTSIVIARNTLFPETKLGGNSAGGARLVLFTSEHGHYSLEKAAQMLGLGSSAVVSVAVQRDGAMDPDALDQAVKKAKSDGHRPFYVNATAGTTVLGSYDPIEPIAEVCKAHGLWLHIDASWGGAAIFSPSHKHKLAGSHLAQSIAINPHKMMGVPLTCSFLLSSDLRTFHSANTLPANYLFHGPTPESPADMYDLADLTLQCGRRGDSLKLYLSWVYHGTEGYQKQIDNAFDTAAYLAELVDNHKDLVLISSKPPLCTQVCFFYAKDGRLAGDGAINSRVTQKIVKSLLPRGFLIDYASVDDRGQFMRPVIHRKTTKETVELLVQAATDSGSAVWDQESTANGHL